MDLIQIQQKLELAEKAASKRYDAAADAKAHYKSLDRQSKNMLASIILEQEGSSKAIKEVKALASSEWEEHCDGLEIAERDYLQKNAKVKALEIRVEILRSLNKNYT